MSNSKTRQNQNTVWDKIKKYLTYQEEKPREEFVLHGIDDTIASGDGVQTKESQAAQENQGSQGSQGNPQTNRRGQGGKGGDRKRSGRTQDRSGNELKKPIRVIRQVSQKKMGGRESGGPSNNPDSFLDSLLVGVDLKVNRELVEEIFSLPKNKDVIIRDFTISAGRPLKAFAVFIEGLSDKIVINETILKPLMIFSRLEERIAPEDLPEYIKNNILPGNQVDVLERYRDIVEKVNYGGTAVFLEHSPRALVVETKGWDRRPVGKPEVEQVIRGPHEAFNETLRSNTGLIRKALRNRQLITEMFKIGERNRTDVAVMYLEDLANPRLVEEVKRRLTAIKSDYVGEVGVLEQFIEEHPFMSVPQALATERPDRVVAALIDGKVAILIDNNPYVLIVPTTFFSLLHSPEDYYLRLPYGNLVRFLRVIAIFIAIITPSVYVAVSNFHQEMLPTELMLAIAASRQTVPFPTILEVFMMEFAFELIREAGVRVPGIIGNTLGIVGALILGQAAVQAGIVSPILIIVVAVTGLASFAIPNYSMSFAFRGVRFLFTAIAAVFGFFGISAGLFILLTSVTSMKSFGVPILAPIGPRSKSEPDLVIRGPMWSMENREDYLDTQDRRRQPKISRGWLRSQGGVNKGNQVTEGEEEGNE